MVMCAENFTTDTWWPPRQALLVVSKTLTWDKHFPSETVKLIRDSLFVMHMLVYYT